MIEYWELTIKEKMADGTFQSVLYQATIKWFSDESSNWYHSSLKSEYFEGEIIQQQNNTSFKIQSGYALNGPFNMGAISFEVIADDGSVRSFHGNIVDELSIWGHCILKDEKQVNCIKAGWDAFRYKRIGKFGNGFIDISDETTIFDVDSNGTITYADFYETKTRGDIYDMSLKQDVATPRTLVSFAEDCPPLQWLIGKRYTKFRDDPAYPSRLKSMPKKPEDGWIDWVMGIDKKTFSSLRKDIKKWLKEEPDWSFEEDYIHYTKLNEGAVFDFFQDEEDDVLDALGVELIDGPYPGNNYRSAELHLPIEKSNAVAWINGLNYKFRKKTDTVKRKRKRTESKFKAVRGSAIRSVKVVYQISDNPVSQFINEKILNSGMSSSAIIKKMGYSNISREKYRLLNVINGKIEKKPFMDKLSKVLDFNIEELVKIKADYDYQQQKEIFRPYLFAVTENQTPSPMWAGGWFGHERFIYLQDDYFNLDYTDQLTHVRSLILEHMLIKKGVIRAFGKIKYYKLIKYFDTPKQELLFFDTSGSLIDKPDQTKKSKTKTPQKRSKRRSQPSDSDLMMHNLHEKGLQELIFSRQESNTSTKPESPCQSKERFKVWSVEQIRNVLRSNEWEGFSNEEIADLLCASIFLYGAEVNSDDIADIFCLYQYALQKGISPETRLNIEKEMVQFVEEKRLLPVVFLPFLVNDNNHQVVAKATIDFVSCSSYVDGELYAFKELRPLFLQGSLADRAVVFGALVAMGDPEIVPFLDELRPHLTIEEVLIASKIHTQFPQHHAIQYWLMWAKELVGKTSGDELANFGSVAAALSLVLRHDTVKQVSNSKRNFPCTSDRETVTVINQWTIKEYANILAKDLYELESLERAPRVFSHVLRQWGLKPRAPLNEQFIPRNPLGSED